MMLGIGKTVISNIKPKIVILTAAVTMAVALSACQVKTDNELIPTSVPTETLKTEKANISIGSRRYEEYTDRLKASKDYGELIPYVGALGTGGEFFSDSFVYGLMTKDGTIVTDPVYSSCVRSDFLRQSDDGEEAALIMRRYAGGIDVAAIDGSWCLEFDALREYSDEYGIRLFSDSAMTEISTKGEMLGTYYYEDMDIPEDNIKIFMEHLRGGFGFTGERYEEMVYLIPLSSDNLLALNMNSGKAEVIDYVYYEPTATEQWEETVENGQTIICHGDESYTIPYVPEYSYNSVHGDYVLFSESGAVYTLDGELFLPADENSTVHWYRDLLNGSELEGDKAGIIARFTYGEQGTVSVSCYRSDGTEIPLPESWRELRGERSKNNDWDITVVGGLLQLVNSSGSSYYNLDTAELVCAFSF